jgi:predicted nucleic acid-binding protein
MSAGNRGRALARKGRGREIGAANLTKCKQEFERDWLRLHRLPIDEALVRRAGELCEVHALPAFDALHLATADSTSDPAHHSDVRLLRWRVERPIRRSCSRTSDPNLRLHWPRALTFATHQVSVLDEGLAPRGAPLPGAPRQTMRRATGDHGHRRRPQTHDHDPQSVPVVIEQAHSGLRVYPQ